MNHAARRFLLRLLLALLFLLPLLWMASASLHPRGVPLPRTLQLLPQDLAVENYGRIWQLVPLGRFILNSLAVVALAVPLTLVTSSWAALAMARLPRRSQRWLVLLSLAVLMVPGVALWSTRFLVYREFGWIDSLWALLAPAWMGSSPFYVLMFYRAFRRIPAALYDAARLDGAGVLQTWRLIALPIARPTALGVALLSFVLYWGDFLSPLLYLSGEKSYTLPVALQLLQQMDRSDWPLLMAAAVTATAVPILLFLLLQPAFARLDR
ncbi:MAG: carbohydrate ABC transporter permease [Anaerolineales bacterium]|nr:carbohydrate ABC transporter permease [Anaerolineales bacterium]